MIKKNSDRKKQERTLEHGEKIYRALAEAADDFVFVIGKNMCLQYVNSKGCAALGKCREKLIGTDLAEIFPPAEVKIKKKNVRKVFNEKRAISFENVTRLLAGPEWLNTILAPICDDKGNVVSVLGVSRDLSVRKRMEDKLRAEKLFTDAVIDSIPGSFYLLDKDGRFLRWNRYEEELFGISSDEFRKRYPKAVLTIHKEDREYIRRKLKAALDKGYASAEARVLTKNGPRNFFMTGKRLHRDGIPYIVGVALDITEFKKASDAIASQKQRYDLIVAAIGQLVYDYNVIDGTIQWSGNIKDITGYADIAMQDNIKEWEEKIHPDDRQEATRLLAVAIEKASPYDVEYRFRHKDGHYLWMHDRGFFITNDRGRAVRMLGIMQDITESKGLEEVKKQLIRAVSHELKTPIGMSKMALDMFRAALDSWDMNRLKESRSILEKNMDRLDKDTENILRLFALEAIEKVAAKRRCSVSGVVNDVIKQVRYLADYKHVKIRVDIDRMFSAVIMSKAELRAVIYNLIDNALKFTQKGSILVRTKGRKGWGDIIIKDTGMGMSREDSKKLFKRFFKGHPAMPGAGLGLVICQDIVRRYGGAITADSNGPGKGSTITVSFPVSKLAHKR